MADGTDDDDHLVTGSLPWAGAHFSAEEPTSPSGDEHETPPPQSGARSAMPAQKRRRVTRACDECRRKKIKCDGKQPCTHCTVYSYGQSHELQALHPAHLSYLGNRGAPLLTVITRQTVRTTNRQIDAATPPRSTSKPSRTGYIVPKRSSSPSFLMSISTIRTSLLLSRPRPRPPAPLPRTRCSP